MTKKKGLMSPLQKRPDPPMFIRGALADYLMNMLLDQDQCQSCARHISMEERWGVVADVRRDNPKQTAYIQAVRLCERCWGFPAAAMKQLTRGWE